MSNPQTPSTQPDPTKAEEIPLEDIDKLLEAEDPEFTKSLEEVRNVEVDTSVEIETSVNVDDGEDTPAVQDKQLTLLKRWNIRMRAAILSWRLRLQARLVQLAKDAFLWLKVRPKEYALFALALLRAGVKNLSRAISAFRNADLKVKLAFFVLAGLAAASGWVLLANFKGVWLPQINEPILRSFSEGADWIQSYDPKEEGESFYAAFPQERYEFLFDKFKVNLKRTADNPLPMGAFEIIVQLDSKDTGIEVRDREVEIFDLVQRVLEDETFNDLETELGKSKLKSRIKREMNQKLTQGWVKDVSFKTFILKP